MGLSFARIFGNKASAQPGQTDAPSNPTPAKADPADAPGTPKKRFLGLKRAAQPQAAAPAPAAAKANEKLLSAKVSARAYRASEFFAAHTNRAQASPKLELAADGLECHANTGQGLRMSFAHSLIQHAVGCYGSLEDSSEQFKHEVAQKIDQLIKKFTPVAGEPTFFLAEDILRDINLAFPHARLSVRVIDGDTGKNNWPPIKDQDLSGSAMRDPNEVLLFYKDERFEAIVADSKKTSISPAPESRSGVPAEYYENISRAAAAGTQIKSLLNLKNLKKPEERKPGAEIREVKTEESVLNNALTPLNIERIASDAPDEISLVTGLLRLATGMHEKRDFPAHIHGITDAEPLHALEAREILQQLDAYPNAKKYSKPAELPENDPRVSKIIEVINQRYAINLNVMLVEADDDGLHKTAMYSAESGGNTLKLDHEDPSATTIVLLRNGNSFEPLRRSAIKTNPFLQPAFRNAHKSFYGNVKAKTADVISLGRRNKVRKMSDDELALPSHSHGTGMKRAMENELKKRWNADRVDVGIQTWNERRKSWFRHIPLENNEYAKKSVEKLAAKLKPSPGKAKLSPKKERLAKLALYQKRVAENHPNATQSQPPVLNPLASGVKFAEVDICFKRLLQTVDAEAMTKEWVSKIYTPTATATKPWNDDTVRAAEKLMLRAWTAARRGFTTGNRSYLEESKDYLSSAKSLLNKARDNTENSVPVNAAFIKADTEFDELFGNLDKIIAGESAEPTSDAFKAFKVREQRELGMTQEAIAALEEIGALKSKAMDQRGALQSTVRKALQNQDILSSLKNEDNTLTPESPVEQVFKAYQSASLTIEEKIQIKPSGFDEVIQMHHALNGIHDAIVLALTSNPDAAQIEKLDIKTLTQELLRYTDYFEPNRPIKTNPAVIGILDHLKDRLPIDMTPVFEDVNKGIFALPKETLEKLQPAIKAMLDAAASIRGSNVGTASRLTGSKQALSEAFPGFEMKYRNNEILHSRIAALENLEKAYVDNRMAAYNASQRQINGEVLTRVLNREAGISHREVSTT